MKRPVIGGILDSATEIIQRAQINLWQPGTVAYSYLSIQDYKKYYFDPVRFLLQVEMDCALLLN